MGKNIKVFLRNSFICVISVCIVVFIYLLFIMAKSTESTIDEISEIYMSEMNVQIRQKFSSIVGLRLDQVEGIMMRQSPDTAEYGDTGNFQESLAQDGNIVAMGTDADGGRILILGKKAAYPMADGGKSLALLAGIPMDYLKEALFLDSSDTLVYSAAGMHTGKVIMNVFLQRRRVTIQRRRKHILRG